MRRFAEAWPDQDAIGQRPVGQLPWGHVIELIEKLGDAELRDWYGAKDIAHGWSRPVLAHQIKTHLHLREGAAASNFPHALEPVDSELAQQITKDPFTLEFLTIDGDAAERQLEGRLVERTIDPLRELAGVESGNLLRIRLPGRRMTVRIWRRVRRCCAMATRSWSGSLTGSAEICATWLAPFMI